MGEARVWRSPLVPGIREADLARRLAEEVAVAEGLLLSLSLAPADYWRAAAGRRDLDRACRELFIGAWLVADETAGEPFRAARAACDGLAFTPAAGALAAEPGAGQALASFDAFADRAGGPHAALIADPAWRPARRFERVAERLSLPGISRALRFRLLVLLGRLGLIEARAPALLLAGAGPLDRTRAAAVRIFAHDEAAELESRAAALAEAAELPLDVLDLALWNLADAPRATLGQEAGPAAGPALERTLAALALHP